MPHATVGTRVICLKGDGLDEAGIAGVVLEERFESYLKRFVVRRDSDRICYVSPCDLALESDPTRTPLGPSLHAD